jgi:hypothetical protein
VMVVSGASSFLIILGLFLVRISYDHSVVALNLHNSFQ